MKSLNVMLIGLSLMVMPAFSADMGSSSQSWLSVAGSAISESGIVSKIQEHIKANKFAYCVATVVGVTSGACYLYRKFYISPELIKLGGIKRLEKQDGTIISGGFYTVTENDDYLNLDEKDEFMSQSFRDLISRSFYKGTPYLLVRLVCGNNKIQPGRYHKSNVDVEQNMSGLQYKYIDGEVYNSNYTVIQKKYNTQYSMLTEVTYLQIKLVDGKLVATVCE